MRPIGLAPQPQSQLSQSQAPVIQNSNTGNVNGNDVSATPVNNQPLRRPRNQAQSGITYNGPQPDSGNTQTDVNTNNQLVHTNFGTLKKAHAVFADHLYQFDGISFI